MADAKTEISLEDLHSRFETAIKAAFPALVMCEFYPGDREQIRTPACALALVSLEPDTDDVPDPGTGQLAVVARFEAHILIRFTVARAKLKARSMGAAFAKFLHLNRLGCPIGPGRVIGVYHEDFEPELDQFEVCRVEWTHVVHLGAPIEEEGPTETPATPVFSWSPKIGLGHEADYQPADMVRGLP